MWWCWGQVEQRLRWVGWGLQLVGQLIESIVVVGVTAVAAEILFQSGPQWVSCAVLLFDCRVREWKPLWGLVAGVQNEPVSWVWPRVRWR